MWNFTKRVAVVSGGASGMGRAVARRFARAGARVVIGDVSAERGEAVAREIEAEGGHAVFVKTDVTNEDDVDNLVEQAVSRFGRLDYAANMAGVPQMGGLFAPKAVRDLVLGVNLIGTINCVAAEVKAMKKSGGGAIVNCSSVSGLRGASQSPFYAAAKHAVIGLTRSTALEMARDRIRVNVICPGLTRSTMTEAYYEDKFDSLAAYVPLGRVAEPDEQASAVMWLCSDEASFVTGAVLAVDGGQTAALTAGPLIPSDTYGHRG